MAGNLVSGVYNCGVGRLPFHGLRRLYLGAWLGTLGRGTQVFPGCTFLNGRKIHLGERNYINHRCLFDGRHHQIRTGNDVSIGPEAAILTLGHDPQSPSFADEGGDVSIGDRVWIAFRAIILPGVKIGEGAVVAAGAVVTRDVEPFAIVAGSPARKVGDRERELTYHFGEH